jgi:uncharacterized protein (DUF1800 family)
MTITRRDFLRLASIVASGATVASCSPIYSTLASISTEDLPQIQGDLKAFRALRRLTYGPRLKERARVSEIGLDGWIEEQLAPESIDDQALELRLRPYDLLDLDADAVASREKRDVIRELKQVTLLRQVYSRRQIYESMVEFWSDHFNITVAKGDCWYLKVVDDREVIRAHAMGNFRDLLFASAHSPAMLVYLDNQVNHREAPNENYAREVMELHTLGVNGDYAQKDVMELARCLTGWTVKEHFWRGQFTFDEDAHDQGTKTVLGRNIKPAGTSEAEQVLEELAVHPATARHIATKLIRWFLDDDPEGNFPELIEHAAQTFFETKGDIQSLLRTILLDGFRSPTRPVQPKFKRPVEYITSPLRSLEIKTNGGKPLATYLSLMGQPAFEWPTPDGPPHRSDAWIGNLMPRWQFALALARNEIQGTSFNPEVLLKGLNHNTPGEILDRLCMVTLGITLPESQRQTMLAAIKEIGNNNADQVPAILTAGMVASPAFQYR